MNSEATSTAPKPFVFVLMPFKPEFNDIYKFGIKGAAEDAGAYSERVDEQDFTEGILDRIYNQINKADVVIADMTGQNSNVFYEVGYAHALDKIVLLLTQDSNDIPFDLKHRPHIVYGGQIEQLRNKLAQKLKWAIDESRRRGKPDSLQVFGVAIDGVYIPEASSIENAPIVEVHTTEGRLGSIPIKITLHNLSSEEIYSVSHIYLFATEYSSVIPLKPQRIPGRNAPFMSRTAPLKTASITDKDLLPVRYRLDMQLQQIPPDAVEEVTLNIEFNIRDKVELDKTLIELRENAPQKEEPLILRIHAHDSVQDFPFNLKVTVLTTTTNTP